MKIYHTETQADYDALMIELERQGCKWYNGVQMTKKPDNWGVYKKHTYVRVDGVYAFYDSVYFHEWRYPDMPIIKYKTKAEEKMKFTKENVYKVFSQYRKDSNFPFNDLQDEIKELDDTPEKAIVPKCFDEWFKEIKVKYPSPDSAKKFALLKLCQRGFGYYFERANDEKISFESELGKWMLENTFLAIDAVLNGYTIEPDTVTEQLYTVVIADRYLVQLFIGRTDFRFIEFDELCAWKPRAFQLTEAEIKAIDERYWTFAVPVKEVAE